VVAWIVRLKVVTLTARCRVPAIYVNLLFSEAGGLVSCGADSLEMFRRAAGYVGHILRGEKPADFAIFNSPRPTGL
jgi:putative tryptophan/tyrosine transport system substrate-binding protein